MVPNLTQPIILNATLIQPPQPLWKDWLPVLVAFAVVALGYYVNKKIERIRSEDETRKHLRDERKELYRRLFREISIFKGKYLDTFDDIDPNDSNRNQYRTWINDANLALWEMSEKFAPEIELIGNLEIGKMLRESFRILSGYSKSYDFYRLREGNDEYAPLEITKDGVKKVQDQLGGIIRMMRAELVPINETRSEVDKEFWWEIEETS
jgi:hypothetical protein